MKHLKMLNKQSFAQIVCIFIVKIAITNILNDRFICEFQSVNTRFSNLSTSKKCAFTSRPPKNLPLRSMTAEIEEILVNIQISRDVFCVLKVEIQEPLNLVYL